MRYDVDSIERSATQSRAFLIDPKVMTWLCTQARRLELVREIVAKQAEDDGLWFVAMDASEAYLQQELRRLHAAVEENDA